MIRIFCLCISLPDSPAEPDLEKQQSNNGDEPKLIPHDEVPTILLLWLENSETEM